MLYIGKQVEVPLLDGFGTNGGASTQGEPADTEVPNTRGRPSTHSELGTKVEHADTEVPLDMDGPNTRGRFFPCTQNA